MKKFITVLLTLAVALTLTACKEVNYTVTFDSQGGTDISAIVVAEGETFEMPADPTKADTADGKAQSFVGWFTDASGNTEFDPAVALTEDTTVYAVWSLDVVLTFDTRTSEEVSAQLLGENGGLATEPAEPTMEGYNFAGWFTTKRGLYWLENEALEFPLQVDNSTTIYAYWEPVNSKEVNYSPEQTYVSSITSDSSLVLNPLTYQWSHEDGYIDMLSTALFSTEVDWDTAIADGVADFPGDFSKFGTEYSIEALDFHWILTGGTNFPIDSDGEEHLTEDGRYDRESASTIKDTEWTFNIREDLVFEDGTPITAADYEYTLKMFLDPLLNNYRSNIFYKTDQNKSGAPIVGAYEYYTNAEGSSWDDVGFEILSDYSFKLLFNEPVSQSSAIGYGNNLRLVHEESFEASLTDAKDNSSYGTHAYPYMSYGSYIIKSWDENQKIVFNKNYDYVKRENVNYKSQIVEIVDDVDQRMQLFADGTLSVAGLSQDYYALYAEHSNLYRSWRGYPQYIILNVAPSKYVGEAVHEHNTIMYDANFRQALLYGFDRNYYATNIYAPNTASLLHIPLDTKSYNQDVNYYSQSPQHLAVLEDLGINPETEGYVPSKAVELFNTAYEAWVAAGNEGAVQVRMISENSDFSKNLIDYIEAHYESLFNVEGEEQRFDMVVDYLDPDANRAEIGNWNFDLSLNSVGFGSSTGAFWQYPAIGFFGAMIGGGSLGLSQPYDASTEDGFAAYYTQEIEIDLTYTYEYLNDLGEDYFLAEELEGHLELFEFLKEELDEDGNVVKPAGIYRGPFSDIGIMPYFLDTPWDGSAKEPFPGATNDTHNFIAALEKVFFEHVPMVPTVTRSDAIVYADNVVIEWPLYHSAFQWGSGRYRYLNTDADFQ
jgi:oligopeptide transport system substrate-binding protein